MSDSRLDFNHLKLWTLILNNAVGTTTSTTLRTLTTTNPDNTNSYFVAPNGSDAYSGDDTAPFLTIDHAIDQAIASGTRNTVHIIRNGYVGDLIFEGISTGKDLATKTIVLQVELGEIATIDELDIEPATAGTSTFKINGILCNKYTAMQVGAGILIHHAYFSELFIVDIRSNSNTFANSIFKAHDDFSSSHYFGFFFPSVQNCIFDSVYLYCSIAGTFSFSHCTFQRISTICTNAVAGATILTITNSILYQVGELIDDTTNFTIQLSYSILPKEFTGTTIDESCQIGVDPLFFDSENIDCRLMDTRRTAPNSEQYFSFLSKGAYYSAIGQTPSGDTKDLGAYDVSYTQDSDSWDSFEFDNEYWNDATIENDLINYENYYDVRGNYEENWDAMKRKISFTMRNDAYVGTIDSYELSRILKTKGAKRWYPFGDTGLWASSGTFVTNDDGDYVVNLSSISDLPIEAYNGYICYCSSGTLSPDDFYLQIKSNSSGSLTLTDHRKTQSATIPSSGTLNVCCQYLPVKLDMSSMRMSFPNWNPQENPLYPQSSDYESWEGHIRELTVREVETDI